MERGRRARPTNGPLQRALRLDRNLQRLVDLVRGRLDGPLAGAEPAPGGREAAVPDADDRAAHAVGDAGLGADADGDAGAGALDGDVHDARGDRALDLALD